MSRTRLSAPCTFSAISRAIRPCSSSRSASSCLRLRRPASCVVLPRNRPHRGRQRRPARRPGHVDDERERRIGLTFFGVPAGAEGVAALPQRLTDALGAGAVDADRPDHTDRVAERRRVRWCRDERSGSLQWRPIRPGLPWRRPGPAGRRCSTASITSRRPSGPADLAMIAPAGAAGARSERPSPSSVASWSSTASSRPRCRQHLAQCQPHRVARLERPLRAPAAAAAGRGLRLRPLFDGAVSLAAGGRQAGLHAVQFGPAMVTRGHDRGVLLADAVLDGDEAGAFVAVLRLDSSPERLARCRGRRWLSGGDPRRCASPRRIVSEC